MPYFRYTARGRRGERLEGVLEASSAEALATQLSNGGATPVDIVETSAPGTLGAMLRHRLSGERPGLEELTLFCRQMHTLLRAGVPIIRGLHGLADTTGNSRLATTIRDVVMQLESGRALATAMGQHPAIFSSLMISLIQVGESTGRLDQAFAQLAEYLEGERELRAQVRTALRYPVTVLAFIAVAIGIINVQVIPQFSALFASYQTELPLATRFLIGSSDLFVAFWPQLLAALLLAGLGLRAWLRSDAGRYRWDRFKLRLPVLGGILERATLARFSRAFGTTLAAGVPIVQALTVTARAVDNTYVGERIRLMRTGVERGDSLARTATATGLFTPLVLQMLAVGEESGAVDSMLVQVAEFYERQVAHDLKRLSAAIEPLLMVLIGAMVLLLMLGVFLPLWDLAGLARQGA